MTEKHRFIIPAIILVAVVGLMATFALVNAGYLTTAGLYTEGTAVIDGNTTLGNASTDVVTLNGSMTATGGLILNNGGAVNGLLVPNGNVGIGTNSTSARLHIHNNSQANMKLESDGAIMYMGASDAPYVAQGTFGTISNHPLNIRTNNEDRIIITNTGDVSVTGNTILGDASTDDTTVTGDLTVSRFTNLRNTRLGWDNTGETWVGNDFRTSFYRPGFSTANLNIEYSAPTERNSSGGNCYVWSEAKSFGVPGPGTYQVNFEQRVGNSSDYTWAYLTCDGRICSDDVYTNNNALNYNTYRSFSLTNNTGFINGGEKLALNFKGADSTDGSICSGSSNIYVRNVTLKGFRQEPVTVGTLMD